jgi:hypothetical protein
MEVHRINGISTTEIMEDNLALVDCTRTHVPKTKITVSRVLWWQNKS